MPRIWTYWNNLSVQLHLHDAALSRLLSPLALRDALLMMGYTHAYHTFDAFQFSHSDCKFWTDAMIAKHNGVGKVPGREEFDQILGHCRAVLDMPAAYFAEELIAAYPDAKVILTVRETQSWYRSVRATLRRSQDSAWTSFLGFGDWLLRMPTRHQRPMFNKIDEVLYDGNFEANAIRVYEEHNARVRSHVPPERLLEYHVKEGWRPLCEFLGTAIPDEPMPNTNAAADFNSMIDSSVTTKLTAQGKRILDITAYTVLATTVVMAVWNRLPARR